MFSQPLPLAFLFDLGGEPPRSFFYTGYVCLFLSLIALPLGYLLLRRRMISASIPRPPTVPFFCVFGSLGGYLLIAGLSPSLYTFLILPFLPLALLSLAASLIYVFRCRPFTSYHLWAAISCSLLLLLPLILVACR